MGLTNIQREKNLKREKAAKSRTSPRFEASAMPKLKSISQVRGDKVKLLNISRRGALIEGPNRLSNGSTISLRLTTEKNVYFVKGRVVRSRANPARPRFFQSGIAFKKDFEILPAGSEKGSESFIEVMVQLVAQ
jgi:hypothetical protein